MRWSLYLGLLAFESAFALNVDSLPIWNPDNLVHDIKPLTLDTVESLHSRIETHGYKTMQVTVGDGGAQIDQELRLSVQGYITDNVYVDAFLSDVDRKAGDQTTATLQEVDQVYFRVESPNLLLHLGDFTWHDESLGLFGFERSTLGAMFGVKGGYSEVRGAVGTDEVERVSVTFNGMRGQRDGYSISSNGLFLSVVPGSEKVWLNGIELTRDKDYVINYAGGLLDFKGVLIPSEDDEIRVDYDSYENNNIYTTYAAKGKFRHPNVYMDISGFRFQNNVSRMKKNSWTDDDYEILKNDKGNVFERDDTLDELERPIRTDRMGARLRLQGDKRFYADFETAFSRKDSNIVSDDVNGPNGLAFRWFLTTDSTSNMRYFPLSMSVYGNYIQEEFGISEYVGEDNDWNSYKLMDDWDLDSNFIDGDMLHDEISFRMKFNNNLFSKAEWGYRRSDDEYWNSSRARLSFTHYNKWVNSELSFARVASFQNFERTRYQINAMAEYKYGFIRPFGDIDVRYTEIKSHIDETMVKSSSEDVAYGKSLAGLAFVSDKWTIREKMGSKIAQRRLESNNKDWEDSLQTYLWQQSFESHWKYLQLEHLLQYEYSRLNDNDAGVWLGDLSGSFGDRNGAIHGNISYKFGLTEEQTYISVYKAVAPSTGDVRYDSLTGTFIEGVDNGDFVYEGKGRNDSIGAILASNASFNTNIELNPALAFGINRGILRDIELRGSFNSDGEDTTSKTLYFPPVTSSMLRNISAGNISWNSQIDWNHPKGFSASYGPGAEYEKIMASYPYFSEMNFHEGSMGVFINENNHIGVGVRYETDYVMAMQVLKWKIYEGSLKYRLTLFEFFSVEPSLRYRKGDGHDNYGIPFDANMKEAMLRLGFDKRDKVNAYIQFSAVDVNCGENLIPYQMMSGYGEGRTFRLETSISLDLNKNISLDGRYVLRFGDAEKNIFQKLSTEARAFF